MMGKNTNKKFWPDVFLRSGVYTLVCAVLFFIINPVCGYDYRGPGYRAYCKNNIKQIAIACAIYSISNEDKYPVRLLDLFPEQVSYKELFQCKRDPDREDGMSYVYVPGHTAESGIDAILVFDEKGNHEGKGRTVGYIDKVIWYSETEFLEILEKEIAREDVYTPEGIAVLKQALKETGEGKDIPFSWRLQKCQPYLTWAILVLGIFSFFVLVQYLLRDRGREGLF